MHNSEIAAALEQIADLLEFQGANQFRVRAYRNAARTVHDLPEPAERIVADTSRSLREFNGIGADLAEKITTLVQTGFLPMLKELQAEVPESVLTLLRIPGLGPKKAAALYRELKIATLDQLRAACEAHQVRALKGFGAKTEATILAGMSLATSPEVQRLYWAEADTIAQSLLEHLRSCQSIRQMEVAGSYRRGQETIGDLDIVAEADESNEAMDRLGALGDVATVIGRGDTKMSVRLHSGLQVDLRIVPAKSFGAALLYFTGSKQHNIVLRGMAKDRGLRINEYGVFRVVGGKSDANADSASSAGEDLGPAGQYIAGRTEAEMYAELGLPLIPPELREARMEFELAQAGALPRLVEASDIVGDLHMHTTESDGKASLEEMVAAAQARGLKYIAITDHSPRVSMANGLNADRLRRQWEQIDGINARLKSELESFRVLKGIEVDILEKGGLDLADDVLSEADWVVASVHYGQNQPGEQITKRILGAFENPNVSAIAHPTGRIIGRRKPYEVDLEAVFSAAARHGKLLELNSNPARLDLNDLNCAAAKRHGIPIVISTDAHSVDGLGVLRYGILQARRAGLTKDDVANTRSWDQLKRSIGKKRE
jgi:DNA polymerase (family 10)